MSLPSAASGSAALPAPEAWYKWPAERAVSALGSSPGGLDSQEADRRLAHHGPNEITAGGGRTLWRILFDQVASLLILILIAAAGVSLALGEFIDAGAILAIVVLFVVLGVIQEYRAERAIAALRSVAQPLARVFRDGGLTEISSRLLVPGDVIRLEAGNVVPADARLLDCFGLRTQEAILTGESAAVEKVTAALDGDDLALGDRRNLVFAGSFVAGGRGTAVVTATGMATELGRIATLLQSVQQGATPLQRRLDGLAKVLSAGAVVLALVIVAAGILAGLDWSLMLLTGVSLAVAIIPEGLPAVLTFALALGAQRMLRRKALIRRLPAVETLGSVTVICSDKTGTLTQNRMTVQVAETLSGSAFTGDGAGPGPEGLVLLAGAVLCNDAVLNGADDGGADDGKAAAGGNGQAIGDPTETALLAAGRRCGLDRPALEHALPRVAELAFDSARKRMTTVHAVDPALLPPALLPLAALGAGAPRLAITKGAAEDLMGLCRTRLGPAGPVPLEATDRQALAAQVEAMSRDGLRVLGLAVRGCGADEAETPDALERDLIFIGLFGLIDPARPEAAAAVATCRTAGIRPVMITGDHPATARAIAITLGMAAPGDRVLVGTELERLDVDTLTGLVDEVAVYARVSPEHKLKIVDALQRRGHVVAMTGDGVNDAPALKKADIGVAMGSGTDVAREAADMVLLDDNFATIVAAVEEGRVVYDNLRRFVAFSVSGNIGKVMAVAVPPLFGLPLLLLPIQILWSNLLTDGLLGFGMGVEAAERRTMNRPPVPPAAGILSGGVGSQMGVSGLIIGLVAISLGVWAWLEGAGDGSVDDQEFLRVATTVFTALTLLQMGRAFSVRSFTDPVWTLSPLGNPTLMALTALVLGLQLAVVYVPAFNPLFHTVPLSGLDLAVGLAAALAALAAMEAEKAWRRRIL